MFKSLRPDSGERLERWKLAKERIRTILEELNKDVFEGKGKITEDSKVRYDDNFALPNMVLVVEGYKEYQIGICTSSLKGFRVSFYYSRPNYNQNWNISDASEKEIPIGIKVMLHKEMG